MLLEQGADPNLKGKDKEIPLQILLGGCHRFLSGHSNYDDDDILLFVKLLLEHGADANAQDNDHKTPLSLAMRYRMPDIVRSLLEHGADPNLGNYDNKTPLHLLLGLQDFDQDFGYHSDDHIFVVAQLLLEHGADVNAQDKSHETPLLLALRRKAPNITRFLLKHGADPSVGNSEGATSCALLEGGDDDEGPICSKH